MKGKIIIQKQSEEATKGTIIVPKSKQHVGSIPAPTEPTQEQKALKGIIIIPKSKQHTEPDLIIEEVPAPTPETPEEVIDVVPEAVPETHIPPEQLPEPEPEATPTEQIPTPEPEVAPTQEQVPEPEPAPETHTQEVRTRVVRINPQMTQRIEH